MTALADLLARQIAAEGPITVATYMQACLLHPAHGYYTTRTAIGRDGDFITAPEISQMFGELVGLCLAQSWLDQGAPAPFTLAELGPGRGTLMADILRATRQVPGFHDAARLHLVEASPVLRKTQSETLTGVTPTWHDSVATLPQAPLFLVANEFFDALPVRQFLRDGDLWRERMVGLHDDKLSFGLSPEIALPDLAARMADTQHGDMVELCPQAAPIVAEIARRIADHGGAALIIDYGGWGGTGDTLQALRGHRKLPPLEAPGDSDLTAHVDFAALTRDLPCAVSPLCPQGTFLERLGISARAGQLRQNAAPDQKDAVISAHRRLTHPDEMGNLFKVLGLAPQDRPLPPGLEP